MAIDSVYDGKSDYERVERDAADGSLERGYRRKSTGVLLNMAVAVVSPALQTTLDAAKAAFDTEAANVATFRASIVALAQKVKDNTATAAEQRTLLVKLSRVAAGLLSDLP